MTDTPKLALYVHDTCAASVEASALFLADNAINCVRTIVVSTRSLRHGQSVRLLTPAEFSELVASEGLKRGYMAGAALFIDAQPVYDSGRVLHTIRTDKVLQLARLAIEKFGKVMTRIVVVCDQGECEAITEALTPEVAAC